MPKATPDNTLSRRALCSGGAGLLLLTAPAASDAMPAPNPDAHLIAECARFIAFELEYKRLCPLADGDTPEHKAANDELDAVSNAQQALGEWIAEQRPQTLQGVAAMARAAMEYNRANVPPADMIGRMEEAIIRNLAGEA